MDKVVAREFILPEESRGQRGYRMRVRRRNAHPLMPTNKTSTALRGEVITPRAQRERAKQTAVADKNMIFLNARRPQEILEDNTKRRKKYAAMRTRQELAATALAAGYPMNEVAEKAGVSTSQVRHYMESADFRERVSEIRQLLFSGVQGRIIAELDRRFTRDTLQSAELMDILRVLDRSMGGKDKGVADITVNNYEAIFETFLATIQNSDSGGEGEDFPEYTAQDLLLPGGDTPSD